MTTTLPNMGLEQPTQGAPGAGEWDDVLDDDLALIDAHDHSTGKGVTVKTAGISINADLTFSSLYAPINLHRITFASIVALTSNNKSLFVNTSDNELYWRSNTGTNVKLTNGSALNVAAFTGGIGGDYVSVGASLAYDDSADRYTFKQEAPGNWARLASGPHRIFEFNTTESVYVELAAPAGLAGSYTITAPLAAPGSTSIVQMDSSGVLSASNTVANAATFSTSVTTPTMGGTPNFTGAVTMASTLGVTGLITATAGVTAAANQHVTVSGTGRHKHGSMTLSIPHTAFEALSGSTASWSNGTGTAGVSGVGLAVGAPVMLPVGCRVLTVRFRIVDNATGTTTITGSFFTIDSSGTQTQVASAVSAGNGTAQTVTVSSINVTLASSTGYSILAQASGAQSCSLRWAEIDYDLP